MLVAPALDQGPGANAPASAPYSATILLTMPQFGQANARWYPRLYFLDAQGRLIRIQEFGESVPEFMGKLGP